MTALPASRRPSRLAWLARAVLPPVALAALILLLLELAKARGWLAITIPAPSQVGLALLADWDDLVFHMSATVRSAALGYGCAVLLAVALGGLVSAWPRAERPVMTLGVLLDAAPLIALAPILMLWLGNGPTLHVIVAATAAFFPLLVGTVQGLKSADRSMRELFHVLAASRWQTFSRLALPQALPYIFAAMKVAAPLAVLGALVAEWMGTDQGLGTMITYALFSFNVPLVWLTILAISALAGASYGIVALAEAFLVTWDRPTGAGGRG